MQRTLQVLHSCCHKSILHPTRALLHTRTPPIAVLAVGLLCYVSNATANPQQATGHAI